MVIRKSDSGSAETAARFIAEKKLVIIPTDTIYGFSGIVPDSAPRIIEAKGRDEGKPFIQLIASPQDLSRHTADRIHPGLLAFWPGPVTVIVRNISGGTTAFRCPGDAWLRKVIELSGAPIYSTSVNRSGQAALKTIAEIRREFGNVADLIVDDGDHPDGLASTLIDATGSEYRVIREGAVSVPAAYLHSPG